MLDRAQALAAFGYIYHGDSPEIPGDLAEIISATSIQEDYTLKFSYSSAIDYESVLAIYPIQDYSYA